MSVELPRLSLRAQRSHGRCPDPRPQSRTQQVVVLIQGFAGNEGLFHVLQGLLRRFETLQPNISVYTGVSQHIKHSTFVRNIVLLC